MATTAPASTQAAPGDAPPAPRGRDAIAIGGWLALTVLAGLVLWRGWAACSVGLLGWTAIDRCPVVAPAGSAALDALAATPLLRAENHRMSLSLTAAEDQCDAAEAAAIPGRLADLAGCWRYVGPGQSAADGSDDGWQICLDATGRGDQRVALPGGVECFGPVSAEWLGSGTAVLASVGDTPCDDGSDLFQVIQQCQWTDSRSGTCIGAQPAQGISGIPGQLVPVGGAEP